jgi:hypothetical protein
MGTTAGLAIGLAIAGIDAELHAIRVVSEQFASSEKLAALVGATHGRLRDWLGNESPPERSARVVVRDDFF